MMSVSITHFSSLLGCLKNYPKLFFPTFLICFLVNSTFATNTIITTTENGETITIHLNSNCDNITDGGQITGNEVGCPEPDFDPAPIQSVSLPSGGSGAIEYLWMYTTQDPNGAWVNWHVIPNSNQPTYDPEPITETTHYTRCSRRVGCTDYAGESNHITKTAVCGQPCILNGQVTVEHETCYGAASGSATAIVWEGTEPYTYLWSDGQTTATAEALEEGTYTVTVTDANACILELIAHVELAEEPFWVKIYPNNVACTEGNSGAIDIDVIGGQAPFAYLWNNGATTEDLENVPAGFYSVVVTDANGCTVIVSADVLEYSPIVINIESSNSSCSNSLGSATANVYGGNSPYTYLWSTGHTGATIDDIIAGTYAVTITDANGCTATSSFTILNEGGISLSTITSNTTCGTSSGSAKVIVSDGTAPYTYQWSDPANQTGQTATGLAAGNYTVTVADANGCSSTTTVTIESEGGLSLSVIEFNTTCGGNTGSAKVFASNGTSPYTYQWNDPANQTGQTATGLAAGNYTVTVTDANGCTAQITAIIESPSTTQFFITPTNPSCGNAMDGSIDLNITAGNGPFTIVWDNAPNVEDPTNLGAGQYCVAITDANNCVASQCITLTTSSEIEINLNPVHPTCSANDGAIDATVNGGSGNYTYTWNTGANTQDINNLSGGNYCLTVTDGSNCTATQCVELTTVNSTLTITPTITNLSCAGANDGRIQLFVEGGAIPYGFSWDNGGDSFIIENLSAGTYCVTITDANNCSTVVCYEITAPAPLDLYTLDTDATCGASNGFTRVVSNNGVAPFTYLWDNGATTNELNDIPAGTYCVTVTDANGCSESICTTISGGDALTITPTITNISCADGNDGRIQIFVEGGTIPYGFSWDNGGDTFFIENLSAGTYCLTITDANACEMIECYTLENPDPITITSDITHPTCSDANDGAIQLQVTNGTGTYSYQWDNAANTGNINNLSVGTYCVTVSDENNCTASTCIDLVNNNSIVLSATLQAPSCAGDADGGIALDISGGTGNYVINWNTTAQNDTLINLSAGEYCVTITDENACSISECYQIVDPSSINLSLTAQNPTCIGEINGTITSTVSGGTGDYTYLWSTDDTTSSINGLGAGSYCLTITDANGCTATTCENLTAPSNISILGIGAAPTCYGSADGSIELIVSGGNAPYTYDWDNAEDIVNPSGLTAGVYCVTVTDANGCTEGACVSIPNPEVFRIYVLSEDATCTNDDGYVLANALNGSGPYSYKWDTPFSQFNAAVFGVGQGTYHVTVTDGNGCVAIDSVTVGGPALEDCYDLVNIGDVVWLDTDMDGIQDEMEMGVSGIMVKLIAPGADGLFGTSDDMIVQTETTDNMGMYLFEDVAPGMYIIEFMVSSLPDNAMLTLQNEGTDDDLDSDANPLSGQTLPFSVVDGQADDLSFDAGIFYDCENVINGGEICCDQDLCGAGAIADPIYSVAPAIGGTGSIEYVWMVNYTGNGFSLNSTEWTPVPDSNSPVLEPGAIYQTTYFIRCARRVGCDVFSGETNIVKLKILPNPDAEIVDAPVEVCINEPTSFIAADGGVLANYNWNFGDDSDPYTANTRYVGGVSWSSTGTKTITLTVDRNGCTATDEIMIDVVDCADNDNEQANRTAIVHSYPNPVHNIVHVELQREVEQGANITLTNAFGHVLHQFSLAQKAEIKDIDLSEYPAGMYYLHIEYGDKKERSVQKLFKARD